jgi:Mg2+-importing ATPase
VKRLDGVQNLGVVTCCCTDKTGTLTVDRVQLNASLSPFNEPSSLPQRLGFVNASLQTGSRSLLDRAITSAAIVDPADLVAIQKLGEIPFDSERRILSVVVSSIGAPATLPRATRQCLLQVASARSTRQ